MQPRVFKAKPHGACLKSQIGLILFSPALPDGWDSVQGPVLAQPAIPLQAANADSVSGNQLPGTLWRDSSGPDPDREAVEGTWPANKAVDLPALSVRWF